MTGCQAELCASNVALPEHVRAGRTCSGKATLRTGRLAGWDTQHTSMSPPLLWRLGSCSASHTAVMVQAPARGLSAGLLLTHDAWHPHWTTLGPTPVKKDQEFARHRSAMVRLARGNAIGPSAERKPRIFHTVIITWQDTTDITLTSGSATSYLHVHPTQPLSNPDRSSPRPLHTTSCVTKMHGSIS